MNKIFFAIFSLLINCSLMYSQIAINEDGSAPDASAGLDVSFSGKGVLIPRMTIDERNAMTLPAEGLMIFCTNCGVNGSLSIYSAGIWQTFTPCVISAPVSSANNLSPGQITWNWNAVAGALGYKWNTTNNYSSATDLGPTCSYAETGILCETYYTRYVWSYNSCAASFATILNQDMPEIEPDAPTEGIHFSLPYQITWHWDPVGGATGYKWNIEPDYEAATDIGDITSKIQAGLNCQTEYVSYVWTYNGCGHSLPTELNQNTAICCGSSIIINHIAGNIAPVTKTTTYVTIDGIPGEPSKCWITSNLGADHQATAKNDATEASAGWYWQFNRMQGFQHDGTTRTPNTTWISLIDEYSDWTSANDPCTNELGSPWRIPTATEWTNVDAAGSWGNWDGPWGSGLKIHAAGRLYYSDGSLNYRGTQGAYWSGSQGNLTLGQALYFLSSLCNVSQYSKTMGFSIRCVKD